MYFLLSGEGATDIGEGLSSEAICEGENFHHGPMALFVNQIVFEQLKYSPLDSSCCGFISESLLVQEAKSLKSRKKSLDLPGKNPKRKRDIFTVTPEHWQESPRKKPKRLMAM